MEPIKIDKVSDITTASVPSGGWCLAVGYSARSLAEALCRAGFSVIACDAFGDQDTSEYAKVPQIIADWGARGTENLLRPDQWGDLLEVPTSWQVDSRLPVFLSGGCENWPELVLAIAATPSWRLLGAAPSELAQLREPKNWLTATSALANSVAEQIEVRFPPTLWDREPNGGVAGVQLQAEGDATWLRKSKTSAGGMGVSSAGLAEIERAAASAAADTYWQLRIEGRVLGASLIADPSDQNHPVKIVGVTESWSGRDWPGPTEFIYRGSFGPVYLSVQQHAAIERLAQRLVQICAPQLTGWLQMDLIEQPCGQLWLLEVNPRWTSGMEVLLHSGLANMTVMHAHAAGWPASGEAEMQSPRSWVGKSIFYATRDVLITRELLVALHSLDRRRFADIPSAAAAGTVISRGHPMLTIRASLPRESSTEAQVRPKLLRMLSCLRAKVQRLIDRHTS